jgi:hypothetical protein
MENDEYISYKAYKRKTSRTGRFLSSAADKSKKIGLAIGGAAKKGYKAATSEKAKAKYKKAGKATLKGLKKGARAFEKAAKEYNKNQKKQGRRPKQTDFFGGMDFKL